MLSNEKESEESESSDSSPLSIMGYGSKSLFINIGSIAFIAAILLSLFGMVYLLSRLRAKIRL